jgi:DNA-binding MarR family transcriptional regulator/N-acetylglutamate synthase-like GNAT family acetyltransferase
MQAPTRFPESAEQALEAVRTFNRFYTRQVGALDANFLGADVSLPEARLLFEIAHADGSSASELRQRLGLDPGYMSRILARFEKRGWISRARGDDDARRHPIRITAEGREKFELIDRRQREAMERMIAPLSPAGRADLAAALGAARLLLGPRTEVTTSIRAFRPGDLGMIAARQSIVYTEEQGWGLGMEVNIAEATAAFLRNFKPGREQCWIAEANGAMAGSVMLTDEGEGLSRLRLLYVEPAARGLRLGEALVGTCIAFAREQGYTAMTLWTHTVLERARSIYAAHGFRMMETEVHETFGPPVHSEIWRLELTGRSSR